MNKRISNGIAWTLLFLGSFLVLSGDLTYEPRHVSFLGGTLAALSVPLFWFGGYNIERCRRICADRSQT